MNSLQDLDVAAKEPWKLPASAFKGSLPIPVIVQRLHRRQAEQWDAVTCFSGNEGCGKSSAALDFAKMMDPAFEIERQTAYSNKALMQMVGNLPDRSAILIDEAIITSWKQEWGSKQQKTTYKMLVTARDRGHCIVFVLPDLSDLHTKIRNRRLQLHFFVPYRGTVLIYGRAPIPGQKDPWHLAYWESVAERWTPSMDPWRLLAMLKNQRVGYLGHSTFPRLPEELEKSYRAYRRTKLEEGEEEEERKGTSDAGEKWLDVAGKLMAVAASRGATAAEIAAEAGLPPEFLRKVLERARATE